MSTPLFLDIVGGEKQWKILDADNNIIGEGEDFRDAVKSARETSNDDITTLSGAIVTQNPPKDLIPSTEILDVLAELAGMKLTKYINDDITDAGYTMELVE